MRRKGLKEGTGVRRKSERMQTISCRLVPPISSLYVFPAPLPLSLSQSLTHEDDDMPLAPQVDQQGSRKEVVLKRMDTVKCLCIVVYVCMCS